MNHLCAVRTAHLSQRVLVLLFSCVQHEQRRFSRTAHVFFAKGKQISACDHLLAMLVGNATRCIVRKRTLPLNSVALEKRSETAWCCKTRFPLGQAGSINSAAKPS